MTQMPVLVDQARLWASRARQHYREFLPGAYRAIGDKDGFFSGLGGEAMGRIEATYVALRRPGLGYDLAAVKMAEETVRGLVFPDPEPGCEDGWEVYVTGTDEEYEALVDLRDRPGF